MMPTRTAHLFANLPARSQPPAAAVEYLRRPVEHARPSASLVARVIRGQRMQPTNKDIDALKGLVRWARTTEGEKELRIAALAEGLERAITALEGRHDSVTEMLLVAIHQAMVPLYGNRWVIVDPDLLDFVGRELVKRYGPNPGAARPEPRQQFKDLS
jgi:redox-sensitive bicupin YhaK (pirin superfamily)